MSIVYDCRARASITNVCPGDLVFVRAEHDSGSVLPDSAGLLPHLVFRPHYARLAIDHARALDLRGDEEDPEYHLDLGLFWAPSSGNLYVAGGAASPAFKMKVYHTIHHGRWDPRVRRCLQVRNRTGDIPRPFGATTVWSADDTTITLTLGGGYSESVRISVGQEYPLGFASSITPTVSTTLYFGIDF